jgi:putative transposase
MGKIIEGLAMVGVLTLIINEDAAVLKSLMEKQVEPSIREKIQALYLLKSGIIKTKKHLAEVLARHESTLTRWFRTYERQGLGAFLSPPPNNAGAKPLLAGAALQKLEARLKDPEGFNSYDEIRLWVQENCGVEASYQTIHRVVRYKLKAKLKVPRPQSRKADI